MTLQEIIEKSAGDMDKASEIANMEIQFMLLPTGEELEYLNTGETYEPTICRIDGGKMFISSWGDLYEESEAEHCEDDGVIRCGYCGEFTENNEDNWHDIKCQCCGHFVDGH